MLFSRTASANFNQIYHKSSLGEGDFNLFKINEEPFNFYNVNYGFFSFLNQHYDNHNYVFIDLSCFLM